MIDISAQARTTFSPSFKLAEMFDAAREARDVELLKAAAWQYRLEMRTSYKLLRSEWDKYLHETDRVLLACYCPEPDWCHRRVLAQVCLCAPKCGAAYLGEV